MTTYRYLFAMAFISLCGITGCQTIDAIPAERVPPQFLGRARANMQEISISRLRQEPPAAYQLAPGDTLGIFIEYVLGEPEEAPPVFFQEEGDQPPAIGFPIPVREDGTLALPLIDPIPVAGLTLEQTTQKIRQVYTESEILQPGKDKVIVTLMRRREYRVLVIREEAGGVQGGGGGRGGAGGQVMGNSKIGTGHIVDLPAYENDVLHALSETGGLPGLDAENEVYILRGGATNGAAYDRFVAAVNSAKCDPCGCPPIVGDSPDVTRIPLRFYPENVPNFTEEDVILGTGDIVYIRARQTERYYTGGLLPGGEFFIPRDYDLDVIKAIAVAGGSVGQGGTGIQLALSGGGQGGVGGGQGGIGGGGMIGPSKLIIIRQNECGEEIAIRVDLNDALGNSRERLLVTPGDTLILQYTVGEEVANAVLSAVGLNLLFQVFQQGN